MLDVLTHFRVIFNAIRSHYQAVEKRVGVSGVHLWALAEVARAPGIRVGNLARLLALHQSTASNMVSRLERLELVARERGADQRSVQLYPTRKGIKMLQSAPQPPIGVLQEALSALPAPRLKSLRRELSHLIALLHVKRLDARTKPLSDM